MTTEKIVKPMNTAIDKRSMIGLRNAPKMLKLFGWVIIFLFSGILFFAAKTIQTSSASKAAPLTGRSAILHLKQKGTLDSLARAVTMARYNAAVGGTGLIADNDANHMRMNFSQSGLRLASTAEGVSWSSNWRLNSVGYGKDQNAVAAGDLRSTGNRIELKRGTQNLTEWFENSPGGLEHGFTLSERPELQTKNAALRLVMTLDGDLTARADADGKSLTLLNSNGLEALRYQNLKAWDANGNDLIAKMRTAGSEVWFDVNDDSAQYPITIDPSFAQSQKLTASDGAAEDLLGESVAVSGDTAIIGASGFGATTAKPGAAYVFFRTNATGWTLQQKLTPSDGAADNAFGHSVSIDGDTAVVGAFGAAVAGKPQQGAAYIFVRSGTTWTQQQKLTAVDGAASDLFGWSVAISVDTVAIGANSDDIGNNVNQGSVYVFLRNGVTWPLQQKLMAADGSAGDFFGDSVAAAGNTLVVGATEHRVGTNNQQGSAYVFVTDGTTWTQQQMLTASDGAQTDNFGFSVALSGNTAIVGTLQNVGANVQQGSAYIFVRTGTTWTQQQKLTANDGAAGDSFGGSVAIAGDRVFIGAFGDTFGANQRQGSAYTFTRTGTLWTQVQKFAADDGTAEDSYGSSVAMTPTAAIIGAQNDATGANQFQGSAYVLSPVVTVAGRVTTPTGAGLKSAIVSIFDPNGVKRSVLTNSFGFYTLDTVKPGQLYLITVSSKRFRFAAQSIQIDTDLVNVDFVGVE